MFDLQPATLDSDALSGQWKVLPIKANGRLDQLMRGCSNIAGKITADFLQGGQC